MEDQIAKNMEHEMATGFIYGFMGTITNILVLRWLLPSLMTGNGWAQDPTGGLLY